MKTSVNLVRQMGNFKVVQRTKDGMFNATDLLRQWNSVPDNPKRDLSKFWESSRTKEFLQALVDDGILNTPKEGYLKSRGKYGGTWMHPYLFLKFAMWLNPRFEVKVIKFVYDQLIRYRNEAGDAYKEMASAIKTIVPSSQFTSIIQNVAKAINYVIYNNHSKGMRDKQAEEQKAKELAELERDIAKFISLGFITSYEGLMQHLRQQWKIRYYNKQRSIA